jgi:hypothetical protein
MSSELLPSFGICCGSSILLSTFHITYTSKYTVRVGDELNFTTKEMISIFPLWTFHLFVATFQQHLHVGYISLRLSDIPELVVPIRISLIEGCCYQESYWIKGSYWLSWSHHFESFTVATMTLLTVTESVTNDHGYVPFVLSTSRSFPHSWLITGFVTRVTWQVPLVEQELLTLRF